MSAVLLTGAAPSEAPTATGLAGVWDTARILGDDLAGPITVTADRAELAGSRAVPMRDGGNRLYRFPGGRGELRVIDPMSKTPTTFWLQPATVTGSRYATPVLLLQLSPGVWRGYVHPLPNRIAMTLYVRQAAGGTTTAFLRDPLYNLGRRFGTMTVTAAGNALRFAGPGGEITGTVDDPNTLTMKIAPDAGVPPLTFTRRAGTQSPGISTYRRPLPTGDGWTLAAAPDVGFATAPLEELARLAAAAPTSARSRDVHAIVVARHGKLVVDDYFGRFDEATPHDTRSAGKTYADALTGAAVEAGVPLGPGTPVLPLFRRYGALANPDPRKARITLGNALSMSTGLDCDDNDDRSVANEDKMQNQTAQSDWYRVVLDARMVRDPGTKAVYCSASINLAGGAIASATHAWLPAYFAQHVAVPMQMQRYGLNLTPTGDWYLGGGAYVRPRDFLKIGQIFLDGGTWRGRRIVPRDWIERSWAAHLSLSPGDGYGYAWHVRTYQVGARIYRAYEAQGNGGQILDVLPQLDLVVMITQGNYNNYATWGPTRDAIVTRVIQAIKKR